MPSYVATINGKEYDVDAPNPQAAADAIAQMNSSRAHAFPSATPEPPRKPSLSDNVMGLMANVNRGLGVGDEAHAGILTLDSYLNGKNAKGHGLLGDLAETYKAKLAQERATEDAFSQSHPFVAGLGRGTGIASTMLVPTGAASQAVVGSGRLMNAARGAVAAMPSAAVYGLTDRGSLQDRFKAANQDMAVSGTLGAVAGALGPRAPGPPRKPSNAQVLADHGVALTPGQRAGGLVKSTEDLAQRAPILGPAVRGARARGTESLNRAVANRALASINEGVPKSIPTGHESVAYVADRLGKVYDDAAKLVPVAEPDEAFGQAISKIHVTASEQPPTVAAQFNSILNNRLFGRAKDRPMSGAEWRDAQSQISQLAADFGKSDDGAQRALGDMLESVSDEMKGVLARANPEAGKLIEKANQGWSTFVRLRNAVSKAPTGVASPSQLSTAVRTMDKSVGKGNVAKGRAVLQDLTKAASAVMPDTFGNPGTADAVGMGALGMGLLTAPQQTVPVAAGLLAASGPYMLMGRKLVEALPAKANRAELQQAESQLAKLAAQDPSVKALQAAVQARLARAAGVSGAAVASAGKQPVPQPRR